LRIAFDRKLDEEYAVELKVRFVWEKSYQNN